MMTSDEISDLKALQTRCVQTALNLQMAEIVKNEADNKLFTFLHYQEFPKKENK